MKISLSLLLTSALLISACSSDEAENIAEKTVETVKEQVAPVVEKIAPKTEPKEVKKVEPVAKKVVEEAKCSVDNQVFPDWACEEKADIYTSIGIASQKSDALANATKMLADDLKKVVISKMNSFITSLGISDKKIVEKLSHIIATKAVQESASKFKELEKSSLDGKLFVQLGIEKKVFNAEIKKAFKTVMQKPKAVKKSPMQSDEVLMQQYESKKALDSLDSE